MMKANFGDALRSKGDTAQVNEILCKVLCHNLCVLVQSMYERAIVPTFWAGAVTTWQTGRGQVRYLPPKRPFAP